ncbi:AT-rich interactive domain-containing protein 5 isoform X1 [Pistacia vera]|uniref:AT-rich interactive domain-containing protein 5 isoform X1 n=1 Tax=Pistacia vera TaxID=55513 RepID=UPI00126301B3|nr:AT-rich interactive domain-containing protein 5 isoform X1 [Pistacia vera]XP_031270179.1 AT-rich interactive domain-containing protein 5 isoform X1 [Pistacia vera]
MEDTEMREQDLANSSDANLVDASVQQRDSLENGHAPSPETTEDKTVTLPSDQQMLTDEPDGKVAITADSNANADNATNELPESKSEGDDTHVENDLKTETSLTPLPQGEYSTSEAQDGNVRKSKNWLNETEMGGADGSPEEQAEFMKEVESFYRENALEFKAPKFYGELLNCLKLWRAVVRLGGYEVVTASKLWRQVGESFHPPKTCTTVSWTFRIFYEKALLEYEKHKRLIGELQLPTSSFSQPASAEKEVSGYQTPGSGRARRDAAARAMQGWHAQRLLGYGEVAEPIIKEKSLNSTARREKHLKNIGFPKNRIPTNLDHAEKHAHAEADKQLRLVIISLLVTDIVDIGPPADWVKISVRETRDCYEIYVLVPGLLREEVRVQSDPAGRLVITGQPEQVDNPWGITPFRKVVSLPGRIDPLRTSAVVSLHGRLLIRVPFEQGSA